MDDIKKKRIIGAIVVIIGLILLAAIIYFLFFYNFSTPTPPAGEEIEKAVPKEPEGFNIPPSPKAVINIGERVPLAKSEVTEEELKRLAASFAERFGSFSNQSPYANILDLKIFMTEKMQIWADKYIEDINAQKADISIYYGITTKAVSTEIKKYDKDSSQAEILVKTQRRKAIATANNTTTSYEDVLIKLAKNKGAWKVDGAYWQTK
jgi:hypothetical protein